MNENRASLIVLLILLASVFQPIAFDTASPGWLTGWSYRIRHTIQGQPGAGTNYVERFYVFYGSGTSSGDYVYLNGMCETDFDDVRFTASDGTVLAHWREYYVSSTRAVFWVEITANLNETQYIYIYYGNSEATDASNGDNTFLLFDHFESWDSAKWNDQYTTTGSRTVENSYLKLATSGSDTGIRTVSSDDTFGKFTAVRFKLADYLWRADRRFIMGYYDDPDDFHVTGTGVYFYQQVSSQGYVENELNGLYTGGAYDGLYDTDAFEWKRNDTWSRFDTQSFYLSSPSWVDIRIDSIGDYCHDVLCPISFTIETLTGSLDTYMWIDWVFVRPYIDPEPTHGSYGNQEYPPAFQCWQLTMSFLILGIAMIFVPIAYIGTQKPGALIVIRLIVVMIIGFALLLSAGGLECVD